MDGELGTGQAGAPTTPADRINVARRTPPALLHAQQHDPFDSSTYRHGKYLQ